MKNKYEICKFYAFDCEGIEEYLSEKALEGWKLVSIYGTYMKFRKSEPEELHYSVEFIPNRFMKWQDSEEARKVKAVYREKNWDFIYEWGDFLVFCSKEKEKPIQISEEEKFKKIAKISAKEFLKLAFLICWLGFLTINGLFINMNPYTLTNNVNVIMGVVVIGVGINIIVDFIRYIVFFIRARKGLKSDEKISYSSISKIKRKRIMDKVFVILYISALLMLFISAKELGLASIGIVAIAILILFIASKWKGKKKQAIMIVSGIFSFIIIVVGLTSIAFSDIGKNVEINLSSEDFGVQSDKEEISINESEGMLGSYIFYSDSVLGYDIIESEYPWIIDFYFNGKVKELKGFSANLEFKELGSYSGYKVNNENYFIIKTLDKVIDFRYYEDAEEDKIISLIDERLIK
ncbi:MAG: DUF2812 domain-containing protein [Clostridium sp.]|uniref:DUF2812 domain-containing protein n=1 Tax=Clostridium sp. TaxID=1506 RepID=UPI003F31C567